MYWVDDFNDKEIILIEQREQSKGQQRLIVSRGDFADFARVLYVYGAPSIGQDFNRIKMNQPLDVGKLQECFQAMGDERRKRGLAECLVSLRNGAGFALYGVDGSLQLCAVRVSVFRFLCREGERSVQQVAPHVLAFMLSQYPRQYHEVRELPDKLKHRMYATVVL